MALSIAWARSARSDLEQIVRYIAQDDPPAARRLGEGITGAVEQIGQFPSSGRVVPEEGDERVRDLLYSPYRIVSFIDTSERFISNLRIWHSSRGAPEIAPSLIRQPRHFPQRRRPPPLSRSAFDGEI